MTLPRREDRGRPQLTRVAEQVVGVVICPRERPATAFEVWVQLLAPDAVALGDLLLVDSPGQRALGTVAGMERVAHLPDDEVTLARLALLSTSDDRRRPPVGTAVRWPRPTEVTEYLAEARRIPIARRVPLAVLPLPGGLAPVFADLARLTGPTATSMLISGMAGSLKTTAGALTLLGVQHATAAQAALVLVNSKGVDLLFADYARDDWARRLKLAPPAARDRAIYAALGYPAPPVFRRLTALVPDSDMPGWRSPRPLELPGTCGYRLPSSVAVRYACAPTDDDEQAASLITRQCIEEAAGPFTRERQITSLPELTHALEVEASGLTSERARWRGQFQATTLAAAIRQLQAAARDLGPILGDHAMPGGFPVATLAQGGTWVVDVAPLPARTAQAVLDELVQALWQAKADGTIPAEMPLVLLVDELNRWSARGPTAARLAAIVRDQRDRRFSLVALAQQLSTLHPQLLANADTLWLGSTRAQELADDTYAHLPAHQRAMLHRLAPGQRLLDMWPLAQPLIVDVPFPSWLVADEGLRLLEHWQTRHRSYAHGDAAAWNSSGGTLPGQKNPSTPRER